jgi:RNA polymerase sigma-70 factor (ECF subfamily)
MLGSLAEAEDAVQDAWLRLRRSDAEEIDNLAGWLTTVVARECLHTLRSRRRRREAPFEACLPDLVVVPDGDLDPAQEAVLHDLFGLPFEDIAGIVGRTSAAARQLASRARRRVSGAEILEPDPDLARRRQVVNAFYTAARTGGFDALVQVLDPDVVLRTDFGAGRPPTVVRGAATVAGQTRAPRGGQLRPALVNGAIGAVITQDGQPYSVMAFTVAGDKIVRIDVLRDLDRVHRLASAVLDRTV